MKKMTALARNSEGNLKVFRYDDYSSQQEFRADLMGNGFRVLKIWNGFKSDIEVENWEYLNRK